MSFSILGLRAELLKSVAEKGYLEPTPIQRQSIPPILEGRDVMAAAQTGTGKTAGFVLPLLQRLAAGTAPRGSRRVRALILAPTRELCAQIKASVSGYGRYMTLRYAAVFGGVGMQPQVSALRDGVDVLVATPGRLLDHLGQGTVDLSRVEILTLDEADRMLDMGFIVDIRRILGKLPAQRQSLMFSATFSGEIRELAHGLLKEPVIVEPQRPNSAAELVTQVVHPVDQARKRELLSFLIKSGDWRQVLVFTRTKHGADRLAQQLDRDGVDAVAIHGNKSQAGRTKALQLFKSGKVRVLVATDIAARGIDILELPHVVNFDLPHVPEDYVHRIGRTGRAGNEGCALSLVSRDEQPLLRNIERLLKRKLVTESVAGYEAGQSPAQDEAADFRRGRRSNPGVSPVRDGGARTGKRPGPRRSASASFAGRGSTSRSRV
ncbi:MAG: DEAD/DEAH box helicase [Gammaproteobacteria bacterium]|nr:DEAD/DEAH box helicase [Gammaproteobacteria bacterium]